MYVAHLFTLSLSLLVFSCTPQSIGCTRMPQRNAYRPCLCGYPTRSVSAMRAQLLHSGRKMNRCSRAVKLAGQTDLIGTRPITLSPERPTLVYFTYCDCIKHCRCTYECSYINFDFLYSRHRITFEPC